MKYIPDKVLGFLKVCLECWDLPPKNIKWIFAIFFLWNISSGDCFHKHEIWEFSPRVGIDCYWIGVFFLCFAVTSINLWIYFKNFCHFACRLRNARERSILFTSFTCLALSTCCIKRKRKMKKNAFWDKFNMWNW